MRDDGIVGGQMAEKMISVSIILLFPKSQKVWYTQAVTRTGEE